LYRRARRDAILWPISQFLRRLRLPLAGAAHSLPARSILTYLEDVPMLRTLVVGTAALVIAVAVVQVAQAGDVLDKKDSLTDKDPGYKPGTGVDKLPEDYAQKFFQFITDNPHKLYTLKLKKGEKVTIRMDSDDMDSVVIVESSKKVVLAFNDDDPDAKTLNSKLVFTAPADDEYRLICLALDKKLGNFHVTVAKAK
jgi:hypothetical protein